MYRILFAILLLIFSCDNSTEPTDCAGVTNGVASEDDCGVCAGGTTGVVANSDKDCAGVCYGETTDEQCYACEVTLSGTFDCAGVCNGDAVEDCAGECGGSAVVDECGVCNGGGAVECSDGSLVCDASECSVETSDVEILYYSDADIYGFQFDVNGVDVVAAGGGDAETAGFSMSTGNNTVLGFSFSGSFIPAGNGTLIDLGGECSTLSEFVFAGEGGSSLDVEFSDDGGGDPVLPTVSIVSPADNSSFDDATSIDVEVSCLDCGDGDHYHAYLDGAM